MLIEENGGLIMFIGGYCGYNTHNMDCDIIYRPNGSANYLFLLILKPMIFVINEVEIVANPGACILYTPGFGQKYQAVKEFYNSFIHFDTDENFLAQYSFPVNTLFYPYNTDDINWYIKRIHKEYLIKSNHYQMQIHTLIIQLFIHIDCDCINNIQEPDSDSLLNSAFQSLRLQMLTYCEEDWPIKRICEIVNLEKSQVYFYYKLYFNKTPKGELIDARIDKAKYLLTNEALQINQVAHASGFSDIYHFSRCFKKICGCSPSKFVVKFRNRKS